MSQIRTNNQKNKQLVTSAANKNVESKREKYDRIVQ